MGPFLYRLGELKLMAGRIMKMREMLKEGLTKEGTTVLLTYIN